MNVQFLAVATVLRIHELSLARFGGAAGIRDRDLLESALAQPRATFGGPFLHEDLFAMAAAYLFHLVKNHPFVDGNKRTGLGVALAFLDVHGVSLEEPTPLLYDTTIAVAEGRPGKRDVADLFRQLASGPR
jgi:death-on-curing protein